MKIEDAVRPQKEKNQIKNQIEEFVIGHDHPCVMAQSIFQTENVDLHVYEELGSLETAEKLIKDLKIYLKNYDFETNDFYTFFAVFKNPKSCSEGEFEALLWKQLQYLHEADDQEWDPSVSRNPESKDFSFSLGGKAFYFVGMHPNSSRKARQSPLPSIAFNLHVQFEKLREMGAYGKVKERIRARDTELQGSINPMLEDFGEDSEAKQYSGRAVDEEWKCPFHSKK